MDAGLPPELLRTAHGQRGVLLGSQIAAVVGRRRLVRLVREGALVRLWRNAYALPGCAAEPSARIRALEMTVGGTVIACLHTAAELFGFDIEADSRTHVLADHDWPNGTPEVRQHRIQPVRPSTTFNGCRVTDLAETVVRMTCRETDPARMLAVLDRALNRTSVGRAELAQVAADLHIRQICLARELIPFADGRAESPGESWLRWVCLEAGFPAPTPQIRVRDEYGNALRIDLGWEDRRVGCEYEGVEFHTAGALTRDRSRYNTLGRLGWLMHGVTSPMIWQHRRALVAEVGTLLSQRAT